MLRVFPALAAALLLGQALPARAAVRFGALPGRAAVPGALRQGFGARDGARLPGLRGISPALGTPAAKVSISPAAPGGWLPRVPAPLTASPRLPAARLHSALTAVPAVSPAAFVAAPETSLRPEAPAGRDPSTLQRLARWEPLRRRSVRLADLERIFDGGSPEAAETTSLGAGMRRDAPSLHELARPWTLKRQLERLEAKPRPASESFEFAVIGDAEPGRFWFWRRLFGKSGVFARQLGSIARGPADFVIQLGDIVSRAKVKNFLGFFRTLAQSGLEKPMMIVIGNHDRRKPHGITDSVLFRSLFGKTNYFFDRGNARFIVLDTSAGRVSPRQLRWLDMALDTDKIKLVFTHMAPAAAGLAALTTPTLRYAGFRKGAEEFVRLAARRGVARVYFGHVHGFGVADYLGVRYVLSGGGGSPLFPGPWIRRFYHYITVKVGPEGIAETVHRLDGSSFPLR